MLDEKKVDEVEFNIPKGMFGSALKELMYKFSNALSRLNEYRDFVEMEKNRHEIFIEEIQSRAYLEAEGTAMERKSASITQEIMIDDNTTSVAKEKKELMLLKYRLARATSKVKELEKIIEVCRSGLSFDKSES